MKDEKKVVDIWVTRYALSQGIIKTKATVVNKGMVQEIRKESRYPSFYHGRDWHLSLAAAQERAEEMRMKKIAALKKQLRKLESMNFKKDA